MKLHRIQGEQISGCLQPSAIRKDSHDVDDVLYARGWRHVAESMKRVGGVISNLARSHCNNGDCDFEFRLIFRLGR